MRRDRKVVAIGGGTGLSTLVRGLKHYPLDITAIVTVGTTAEARDVFVTSFICCLLATSVTSFWRCRKLSR